MISYKPGIVTNLESLPVNLGYDIEVYTDGSADNIKGGRCAWTSILNFTYNANHWLTAYCWGSAPQGTSPYAEMMAIHCALSNIPEHIFGDIKVVSDSEWAIRIIEGRYAKSKFLEEWAEIDKLIARHKDHITFTHIRGHQGNVLNEQCDKLATIVRKTGQLTREQIKKVIDAN